MSSHSTINIYITLYHGRRCFQPNTCIYRLEPPLTLAVVSSHSTKDGGGCVTCIKFTFNNFLFGSFHISVICTTWILVDVRSRTHQCFTTSFKQIVSYSDRVYIKFMVFGVWVAEESNTHEIIFIYIDFFVQQMGKLNRELFLFVFYILGNN